MQFLAGSIDSGGNCRFEPGISPLTEILQLGDDIADFDNVTDHVSAGGYIDHPTLSCGNRLAKRIGIIGRVAAIGAELRNVGHHFGGRQGLFPAVVAGE